MLAVPLTFVLVMPTSQSLKTECNRAKSYSSQNWISDLRRWKTYPVENFHPFSDQPKNLIRRTRCSTFAAFPASNCPKSLMKKLVERLGQVYWIPIRGKKDGRQQIPEEEEADGNVLARGDDGVVSINQTKYLGSYLAESERDQPTC